MRPHLHVQLLDLYVRELLPSSDQSGAYQLSDVFCRPVEQLYPHHLIALLDGKVLVALTVKARSRWKPIQAEGRPLNITIKYAKQNMH